MYQYTNNAMSSFQSLPDTYYPSSQHQPHHQQQGYEWYPQQVSMAATSASVLAHPSYPLSMTPPPPPPGTTASPSNSNTTATTTNTPPSPPHPNLNNHNQRPKITTSLWEDEGTICYQVDARGICVARRQDNDMINGTKLLNVTGMSRGKRDGILKNEKGRVVVKVGAMHLKGVWVTFSRAKALAIQHNIKDVLEPLFVDDPSIYFYSNPMAPPHANYFIPTNQQQQHQPSSMYAVPPPPPPMEEMIYSAHRHTQPEPTRAVVPSMGSSNPHLDYYAYRNNSNMSNISSTSSSSNAPSLLQDHMASVDQLDQHSLLDYASKASSSMFSLPSPGTPSQQSLFYNDTALDQYYHHQPQQQQKPSTRAPVQVNNDQHMLDLPMAPTLPSSNVDGKSFYYTHPCASTASFHDQPSGAFTNNKFQQDHQATLEFYGSYTPSSQQQQQQYSAQPW